MTGGGQLDSSVIEGRKAAPPNVDAVRRFWSSNPLFAGESAFAPGTKEFFEEHERVTLHEHSGSLHPIFLAGVEPGRDVLDVGCGNGFWTTQFARRGARVSACDLTERAVELTRQRLALSGLSADVRVGNAEALPYADNQFDHVNCQGVIHHTPDTERCVAEFARVAKPGGTVCFSVYYKVTPLRSPRLFKVLRTLARPWVGLPGRGRERMLDVKDPDEFVRLYDGVGNPIGKSYTKTGVHELVGDRFEILEELRFGFPRRAFPIPLSTGLHTKLSHTFGLMIAVRCRKPAVERSASPGGRP